MSLPSDDFARQIFFKIHNGLPRQGPGSTQSTLRALHSINPSHRHLDILDVGCGSGVTTFDLARLGHRLIAIDNHELFIETVLTRAKQEYLSERITAVVGDMFRLPEFVAPNTFDVIWSEGSIYIIGFERGLTEWKKFLKKDGYLVCSELSWLTKNPPFEAHNFWSKHYPNMRSREENIRIIKECGYELIDSFVLAEDDWWNEYYGPMEQRIHELKLKYKGHQEAESVLNEQLNGIIESNWTELVDEFDQMNLREPLLRGIYGFGFERPSAIQQRAIKPCILGHDVIAQAQSGTGKTATFTISILQRIDVNFKDCQALILAPTRELAQQIQKVVLALGDYMSVTCHACIGGNKVQDDIKRLESGVQVVVGTPGRVYDMLQRRALQSKNIKMLVLDEADEMLKEGFKEQIYNIFMLMPENIQV
ncbi:unnamed protein product [Rotaria sp. Silwood2]|nr:unnamed protein product [Rotaria sp. Silwood2]